MARCDNKRFTRITALTVSAAAAKAIVSCKGKGCPKRTRTNLEIRPGKAPKA